MHGVLLTDIVKRLEGITPDMFMVPTKEPGLQDHVVCTANDSVKRFHALVGVLADEYNAQVLVMKADNTTNAQQRELASKASYLEHMLEVARAMLWTEVAGQHPDLAAHSSCGIRKGWQLCWSEEGAVEQSMERFLNDIFGSCGR